MTTTYDAAVVGGGLAGLTAATLLARNGRSVVLFDARKRAGGRARSTDVDGYVLNEGPHALYRAGRAARVLRSLGIEPDGGSPPLDQSTVVVAGDVHRLPVSPVALLGSRVLGTRGKAAAARILPTLQRGRDRRAEGLTLAAWLDRRRAPGDLRSMIEMYVRLATYSNAPEALSAPAALAQFALAIDGVRYLHGGWQQLVDGLVARASDAGVVLHHETAVRSLGRDGPDWVVTGDEDDVAASDVVLAASGPRTTARLAGSDPGWVEGGGPPSRVSVLDLGIRARSARPILLSMDGPLYGSAHAPTARLAPEGRGLVSVMRYLRHDERPVPDPARAELEAHAGRMGIGEWSYDRFLLTMTAGHGVPVADRPRPTGFELAGDRLWVCGDWVAGTRGEHSFLADASVGSAADVADGILRAAARAA